MVEQWQVEYPLWPGGPTQREWDALLLRRQRFFALQPKPEPIVKCEDGGYIVPPNIVRQILDLAGQ